MVQYLQIVFKFSIGIIQINFSTKLCKTSTVTVILIVSKCKYQPGIRLIAFTYY